MSYCVNCGVELNDSEKHCPLCHVEVLNPKAAWEEPSERPYPRHLDAINKRIDRRYFAILAGLILAIPCIITVIMDIFSGGGLTWSAYVIGAVAMAYVFVLLPFYFKRYHTMIFLSADCAAVLLYLLFIERMNGGDWFMSLGLPLTAAASICVIAVALLSTRIFSTILLRAGIVLIAIGLFVVSVEIIIDHNAHGTMELAWSLYALIPCVVLGVVAMMLERRKTLKENVRRRLFY